MSFEKLRIESSEEVPNTKDSRAIQEVVTEEQEVEQGEFQPHLEYLED